MFSVLTVHIGFCCFKEADNYFLRGRHQNEQSNHILIQYFDEKNCKKKILIIFSSAHFIFNYSLQDLLEFVIQ